MVDTAADVASLRAEVERLRHLVGPCEQSYDDLRVDLLAARDAAKDAELAAGAFRGELTETNAALDRALAGGPALGYVLRQAKTVLSGTFLGRAYRAAGPGRRRARYSAGAGIR